GGQQSQGAIEEGGGHAASMPPAQSRPLAGAGVSHSSPCPLREGVPSSNHETPRLGSMVIAALNVHTLRPAVGRRRRIAQLPLPPPSGASQLDSRNTSLARDA